MQPEPQSTAAATTASPSHRSPVPSAALASFEGSGSGEPSGDDQTEEEEELEEEAGSGIPSEASGADDPVGKSLLFHFITHNALTGVWVFKKGWDKLIVSSELTPYHIHAIIC